MNNELYMLACKARIEAAEQAKRNRLARELREATWEASGMALCIISALTVLGLLLLCVLWIF